ncbi:invasion protein [Alteromonadaceae bacterium M269]|nr:invasion protein [Alteromonadaceae bacterium M269]
MYAAIKHLHLTAVALSVLLLVLRFIWLQRSSDMLQKKWVKIVPHAIDTVLLLSAATLCVLIAQYPFVHGWITEKFIAVIIYIFMGFVALKIGKTKRTQWIGFVGAIFWLAVIGKLAVLKQPFLL